MFKPYLQHSFCYLKVHENCKCGVLEFGFQNSVGTLHTAADTPPPRVGLGCVLCTRIDPIECHRRRLNQGLVVVLGFFLIVR